MGGITGDLKARGHSLSRDLGLRGFAQSHALGRDCLPPTIVDIVPIHKIDPVRQVAVAEGFAQSGGFVERQPTAGIDR